MTRANATCGWCGATLRGHLCARCGHAVTDVAPARSPLARREIGAIIAVLVFLGIVAAAALAFASLDPPAPAVPAPPAEGLETADQAADVPAPPGQPSDPAEATPEPAVQADAAQADPAAQAQAPAPDPEPPVEPTPEPEPEPAPAAPAEDGRLFDPSDPPREPANPEIQSPVGPSTSVLAGFTIGPQPILMSKPFYAAVYLRQVDGRAAKQIEFTVDGEVVAQRRAVDPALEQITVQLALATPGRHAVRAHEPTTGEVIGTFVDVLPMRVEGLRAPPGTSAGVPLTFVVPVSVGVGAQDQTLFFYVDGKVVDAKRIKVSEGPTQDVPFEIVFQPGRHTYGAGFEGSGYTTGYAERTFG